MRPLLCTLLLPLLVGASARAEDFDLRELLTREPGVGQVVHEDSSVTEKGSQIVRSKGQVVQRQAEEKLEEYERVVEVLAADKEGNPQRTRYTYESYAQSLGDTERVLEVEGLVVVVDQTQRPAAVSTPQKRQIPPFLENRLQDAAQQDSGEVRLEKLGGLLPKGRVAVGKSWTKEPKGVAKLLELPKTGIDARRSSCVGRLREMPGGQLRVEIKAVLVYPKRFQGRDCLEPMKVEFLIEAEMPRAKKDPTGSFRQQMKMAGVVSAQGYEVAIDVDQETKTILSAAERSGK